MKSKYAPGPGRESKDMSIREVSFVNFVFESFLKIDIHHLLHEVEAFG